MLQEWVYSQLWIVIICVLVYRPFPEINFAGVPIAA
jgi:hypothetical protein